MSQRFSDTKSRSNQSNLRFSPYSTIQGKDRRVNERSTAAREHGMSSLERMETDPKPGSSSQSTGSFGRERKESSSRNSGSAAGNLWKTVAGLALLAILPLFQRFPAAEPERGRGLRLTSVGFTITPQELQERELDGFLMWVKKNSNQLPDKIVLHGTNVESYFLRINGAWTICTDL